ncbi:MAG: acyl-CoA thioesterase [Muribaculaceae bacterium]|nr:acyl-CoA thioesterase [Muribaculaceae bacterium]MDE6295820.1 acyl-CoA thioesterase [Muribaculaceae bacterium]
MTETQPYTHHIPVQLRFNDIDILGHLNNTVYFSLFDLAKARYFAATRRGNMDWQKVECVIANVNCAYINQVRFGENIEIYTRCKHVGDKSFILDQLMVNVDTDEVKARCETVMVCIDPAKGVSVPVSDYWRQCFADYENNPTLLEKK